MRNLSVSSRTAGSSAVPPMIFAVERTESAKSYAIMPSITVSKSMTTASYGGFADVNSTLLNFVSLCTTRIGKSPAA